MSVNGYKYWANLCYIIDEGLRVKLKSLWSHWCFPQLIKAAKSYAVSWDRGGQGIGDNTSILSSFGFGEAAGFQLLQCCFPPSRAAPSPRRGRAPSMGLFISSPPPPHFHFSLGREQRKNCSLVPRTLTLFKLDQKATFLVNKQIRNLFSAQHTSSAFQVPLHTRFWLDSLRRLFSCCWAKLQYPNTF